MGASGCMGEFWGSVVSFQLSVRSRKRFFDSSFIIQHSSFPAFLPLPPFRFFCYRESFYRPKRENKGGPIMDMQQLVRELKIQNKSKIVMLVADGLGGLPIEPGG